MKFFLKHLIYGTLVAFMAVIFYITGIFNLIYDKDFTKISFIIIAAFIGLSLKNIKLTYNLSKFDPTVGKDLEKFYRKNEVNWIISDWFISLGLIGTMFGLIVAIGILGSMINIDISSMQTMLPKIALKISTALYTTLIGLIASQFLKFQALDISNFLDKKSENLEGCVVVNNVQVT